MDGSSDNGIKIAVGTLKDRPMKFQIPSLFIGLILFSAGACAQTNGSDSIQKINKANAAEQAAKADVYIVKKSLGKNISEEPDSVVVKNTGTLKKNSTRKTRKVSCSSKNYQKKKA